ncbi:MAG: NADH:flavin oxidoreductase/NADH oxidase family protein [Deltaproteobacteria bacterium]|nr:NADH:flavin oxidoreductase/NADH oxidase family protein [Deltaproteobacteria bacterium]
MSGARLGDALTLPCGQEVKNRLLKSAMSEGLGARGHLPDGRLGRLYRRWAEGGTGVLVTGNVMIDPRALGEPGNVVLEAGAPLEAFAAWAEAASADETKVWMQLNHPGKQAFPLRNPDPVAPSAIGFEGPLKKAFPVPRALEASEIREQIERFATAAALAEEAGFHGAQIHGAHGYLVSQFLSPRHNRREDEWGGSLENRMRFALEIFRAIRARVRRGFAVTIKLNSADFQRGGFSEEEALEVVARLGEEGIDLIEISGGTYEAPAMTGSRRKEPIAESTRAREAYFLDFARKAREATAAPLALTGGFRTAAVMEEALASGAIDLVGLARPLAMDPDASRKLLAGEATVPVPARVGTGLRALDTLLMFSVTYYEAQLSRMAAGKEPDPGLSPWRVAAGLLGHHGLHALRPRRARG